MREYLTLKQRIALSCQNKYKHPNIARYRQAMPLYTEEKLFVPRLAGVRIKVSRHITVLSAFSAIKRFTDTQMCLLRLEISIIISIPWTIFWLSHLDRGFSTTVKSFITISHECHVFALKFREDAFIYHISGSWGAHSTAGQVLK